MPPSTAVVKPSVADRGRERLQLDRLVGEVERRLEPAQPRGDGALDDSSEDQTDGSRRPMARSAHVLA